MPLIDGQGGIDCMECGHKTIVTTHEAASKLSKEIAWRDGDAVCPECGASVTFEDYTPEP